MRVTRRLYQEQQTGENHMDERNEQRNDSSRLQNQATSMTSFRLRKNYPLAGHKSSGGCKQAVHEFSHKPFGTKTKQRIAVGRDNEVSFEQAISNIEDRLTMSTGCLMNNCEACHSQRACKFACFRHHES